MVVIVSYPRAALSLKADVSMGYTGDWMSVENPNVSALGGGGGAEFVTDILKTLENHDDVVLSP